MAAPARPNEITPADTTALYLAYQHDNQAADPTLYIHGRVVSYYTGKAKADWIPHIPDGAHRDVYSAFTNANRGGALTTIALFQTWGGTWVNQLQGAWMNSDWHCWLGATVRTIGVPGKVVVIWDSNANTHASDVAGEHGRSMIVTDLIRPQRTFIERVRAGLGAAGVTAVWYGGSGNSAANPICTTLAAQQLENWASNGIDVDANVLANQGFYRVAGN